MAGVSRDGHDLDARGGHPQQRAVSAHPRVGDHPAARCRQALFDDVNGMAREIARRRRDAQVTRRLEEAAIRAESDALPALRVRDAVPQKRQTQR